MEPIVVRESKPRLLCDALGILPLDLLREALGVYANLERPDVDFDWVVSVIQSRLHQLDPVRHLPVNPDGR